MGHINLSQYSQELGIGGYTKPDKFSPRPPILLFKVYSILWVGTA
jgi:hypothetical protein